MSPTAAPRCADAVPHIGFGTLWHTRLRPRGHRFALRTFFLLLPMRRLRQQPQSAGALALNCAGALSFHDVDHGDARPPDQGGALAWLDELLAQVGIHDAQGEVWLHCYPRVLGYSFKPVSFWYCHQQDGRLRAIVVEVNNTFGERHVYLIDQPTYGREVRARKAFYVSPFCPLEGGYRFEFQRDGELGLASTRVRIDFHDAEGPLLLTGVAGRLQPLDAASRRRALWGYPLMTLGVIVRIHWHALRLWLKRIPLHPRPTACGRLPSPVPAIPPRS